MNVREITDQVIEITGETIDLFKVRRYINNAISLLSSKHDTACSLNTTTITCNDINGEYSLPLDCFGVDKVTLNGCKFNSYIAKGGFITFGSTGDFTVRYMVQSTLPTRKIYDKELGTDIPGINAAYHMPICFYVAAEIFNANDPRKVEFMNNFNSMCNDVNSKLLRQKRKGARIKAPLFR